MRLFLDTDILLDVLLERVPFFEASARIVDWGERHAGRVAVSWHGMANLHYMSKDGAEVFIGELLEFAEVPQTGTEELRLAIHLGFPDLEDAMQAAAAVLFDAQWIVTRNIRDYVRSPVKAIAPRELVSLVGI